LAVPDPAALPAEVVQVAGKRESGLHVDSGIKSETPKRVMGREMANSYKIHDETTRVVSGFRGTLIAAIMLIVGSGGTSFAATPQQKSFRSAEEAVKAYVHAARTDDNKGLIAIFGPAARELIFSGDAAADAHRRAQLLKAYDEKNRLDQQGDRAVLTIGNGDWPFPIPLVKKGETWVFDTEAGKEEILNRRIGENELRAIQVCRAIVDAQREYAMKDRMSDGYLQYAQKFASDPGKKNGLYWKTSEGEAQSPLGPLVAAAVREGYKKNTSDKTPIPYHGYYYKILKSQGRNASGGAYSYLVKGKMIGGFALVAYPAQYGNSGVMTFTVNHDGNVFQKNLGKDTASVAAAMTQYNPDSTWREVKE